ncbi:MAG: polyprenyl synthetase family protein, partial [Bdellovibrionales bacterium]|nr:polyprenyl synthetase family protein [Bdellovibrionales bacterium]
TCHRVYGEAAAILAGDILFAEALRIVSSAQGISAEARAGQAAELSNAFVQLCQGQDLDLLSSGSDPAQGKLSLEQIEDRHLRKTASLIRACAVGPVYLLGTACNDKLKATLSTYGTNLGLLFQVTDDVLDVTGTTEQLGKSAASDEATHTETFTTLLGVDGALDYARSVHKTIVSQLEELDIDSQFLVGLADFALSRDR